MNNTELLHALGQMLINNTSCISMDLAFENYINFSKIKCRKETIVYYNKKWKVLKPIKRISNKIFILS